MVKSRVLAALSITFQLIGCNYSYAEGNNLCYESSSFIENNYQYGHFEFDGQGLYLPLRDPTQYSLPFEIIEKIPFNYVNIQQGMIWQGFTKNHGMGFYFRAKGELKDQLIVAGQFISVFKNGQNIYAVKNSKVYDKNLRLKRSANLYLIDTENLTLNEVKKFPSYVEVVRSKTELFDGIENSKETAHFIVGDTGWAYLLDAKTNSRYLNCKK